MEARPKIKVSLSYLDKKMELLSTIIVVAMWGLTIYIFLKSPTTIPLHYNTSGNVNSYGNKVTLLILPAVATVVYFGLTKLNEYPHLFNYMIKITEENALRQYTIATRILRFLKLAVLLIFTLITLLTYLTAIGVTKGLGSWFLPLALGLILIPQLSLAIQSSKSK